MAILNSTPLIYLTKIGKLPKVIEYFNELVISSKVYEEAVEKGLKLGKPEAEILKKYVSEGKIRVEKPKKMVRGVRGIHIGELESISLAIQRKDPIILDDKLAYEYSKLLKLNVIRTVKLLLILLKNKLIDFSEFKRNLSSLSKSGFWLTSEIYEEAVRAAEELSSSH